MQYAPLFVPAVGRYYKGMLVQVPLQLWALPGAPGPEMIQQALADHYTGGGFVSVAPLVGDASKVELNPEAMNATNQLEIRVFSTAGSWPMPADGGV